MKVLIISGSYPPIKCGVSEGTVKLSTYLRQAGASVRVLTSEAANQDEWSIPVVKKWTFSSLFVILKHVRQEKPVLIHIEYPAVPYGRKPFINFLPLILRLRFPRTPVVIRAHEYHDASWLGKARVILTVLFANAVVIPNQESLKAIKAVLPWKNFRQIQIGSNIAVVPLTDKLRRELVDKYNLASKDIVTYFGLIDPSKGVEQLVDSIPEWPANSMLVIATHCDPENDFHTLLKEKVNATKGRAVWTGFLPENEISGLLQLSKIVALPFDQPISLRRGSMLAALVHGVPVITTGPAKPPLVDKENLYLLPDNHPTTLATAINQLMGDGVLQKRLHLGALELAADFDWLNIAKQHLALYRGLLNSDAKAG